MKYFDAHCHIQFDAFDADREAIAAKMQEAGIGGLVVGCDAASSRAATEFVQKRDGFWAAVGQHPNDNHAEEFDEHLYRNLLMYPKVVAIGECGLDYFRVPSEALAKEGPAHSAEATKAKQKDLFRKHVNLAGSTKRPLIVHARPSKGTTDAYKDALDIIEEAKKEFPHLTGDLHFFVGDVPTSERAFALGFTISYTAVLTFTHDYDGVIQNAPLDRILTETDSPYVAPTSRRGQRNDPLSIPEIVQKIAEIRGEDLETVREATLKNAERLFALAENAW
ncbi:MAG TPA: TatD family hydrolase [Candidatus Paceibacterota bacterium]|nr:TatD family hydrolase [Candidatus Paceibacterota bacterium]